MTSPDTPNTTNDSPALQDFYIDVCRTAYAHKTIKVRAANPTEAGELALDEAGNHTYTEKSSEYTLVNPAAPTQAQVASELIPDVDVIFEAYADGDGDGPIYATKSVSEAFIQRILNLQAICLEHRLDEVRVGGAPNQWGPGDVKQDLQLRGPKLVVTDDEFWFTDYPKHGDYSIETRACPIDDFVQQVRAAQLIAMSDEAPPQDDLYFGKDGQEEEIREMLLDEDQVDEEFVSEAGR